MVPAEWNNCPLADSQTGWTGSAVAEAAFAAYWQASPVAQPARPADATSELMPDGFIRVCRSNTEILDSPGGKFPGWIGSSDIQSVISRPNEQYVLVNE